MRLACSLALSTVVLGGCYASHERTFDAGPGDSGCLLVPGGDAGTIRPEKVDLLLMVDNSNSMTEEQASLAEALPALVRAIGSGDADLDGDVDFAPVESLQLGVVTSDMGTGGFAVPSCPNSDFGDDGILRTVGNTELPGCEATFPPFLTFRPGEGATAEEFAMEAACLTTTGTGGCGFEQQLEAVLKAVSPPSGPRFFRGTTGHARGANEGLVRPDSVLAILMVTDEDDCSALDPGIYEPDSTVFTADLNLRCNEYPEALHPIERYADGLLAVRRATPGRLVFASIVGVPPDLSGMSEPVILEDDRLDVRIDPVNPTRAVPSCNVPERGLAFPPRRILHTSARLREAGARTTVLSICVDDFSPAVRQILQRIGAAARPICR